MSLPQLFTMWPLHLIVAASFETEAVSLDPGRLARDPRPLISGSEAAFLDAEIRGRFSRPKAASLEIKDAALETETTSTSLETEATSLEPEAAPL